VFVVPRHQFFTTAVLGICVCSGSALGHAPPLGSVLLSDAQGRPSLLVSNRGLLFRREAEQSWSLLCNEALRINTAELPNVVLLPDGEVLVGTTSGLQRTEDRGCSWLDVDSDLGSLSALSTPALAADPTRPDTLYAFVYTPGEGGLRKSSDGGRSFELVYRTADEDYVDSLLVAASNPDWIYASGARFAAGQQREPFLLRSTDAGRSWLRSPLPLEAKEYRAPLLATDPARPEGVLIGTITATPKVDPARVLLSSDGGRSFAAIFQALEIASARYTQDGTSLLVADQQGLQLAEAPEFVFRSSSPASNLGCAFELGGELLVCGHYEGPASPRSGVGRSRDGGASFTTWLDFADVVAPVSCSGDSPTAALCTRPWQDWELEMLPAPAPPNGTTSPVPSPAPGLAPDAPHGRETAPGAQGCGLRDPGRGGAEWLLLLLPLWVRRARSRARIGSDLSRRAAHGG
jgi:photosystem II stability/assembly factor-like uncharacterized protein